VCSLQINIIELLSTGAGYGSLHRTFHDTNNFGNLLWIIQQYTDIEDWPNKWEIRFILCSFFKTGLLARSFCQCWERFSLQIRLMVTCRKEESGGSTITICASHWNSRQRCSMNISLRLSIQRGRLTPSPTNEFHNSTNNYNVTNDTSVFGYDVTDSSSTGGGSAEQTTIAMSSSLSSSTTIDDVIPEVIPKSSAQLSPMAVHFIIVGALFVTVVILALVNVWIHFRGGTRARRSAVTAGPGMRGGTRHSTGGGKRESRKLFMRPARNLTRLR